MTTVSAAEVPADVFNLADVVCELAGSTRTRACDLNLGRWVIEPADEWGNPAVLNWWVSLTADGREFKIFRFVTRADALTWVEEVCGHVNWIDMGA
ncbi:hypothetical protein [Leucobacter sp. NPDC077196]|uniref:hypothetical protein n=1 Tax=Leucobacter sp. NPDC077196 TaxID=3154959 RepID=UPI00343DC0E4